VTVRPISQLYSGQLTKRAGRGHGVQFDDPIEIDLFSAKAAKWNIGVASRSNSLCQSSGNCSTAPLECHSGVPELVGGRVATSPQ